MSKNNFTSVYNKPPSTPPPPAPPTATASGSGNVVQTEPKEGRFAALKRRAKVFIKGKQGQGGPGPSNENVDDVQSVRRNMGKGSTDERSTKQSKSKARKKGTIRRRDVKDPKNLADETEVIRRRVSTGMAREKPPLQTPAPHKAPAVSTMQPAPRASRESLTPPPPKQESQNKTPEAPPPPRLSRESVPAPTASPVLVMSADPMLPPIKNAVATICPPVDGKRDPSIDKLVSATGDEPGNNDKTQSLSESGKNANPRNKSAKQKKHKSNTEEEKERKAGGSNLQTQVAPTQMTEGGSKVVDAHRSNVILVLRKFYDRAIQMGVVGLVNEFKSFPKVQATVAEHKTFLDKAHLARNRYKDVPCVEFTRVKVGNNPDKHDYIHANYVSTDENRRKFICCQAPMQTTVGEFWLMLLNEGCQAIVMLCNVVENNSPKCVQYWNPVVGESLTIKNVVIKTVQKTALAGNADIMVTVLAVKNPTTGQVGVIKHYQWVTWPDKGVPKDEKPLLMILQEIRKYSTPVVVHCSAGIGRTGSVVMVELILEKFMKAQVVEVPELLKLLRKQRANCVQTETQYLFVHFAIMHHFVRMCTISESYPGLSKFFADYERICNAVTGG